MNGFLLINKPKGPSSYDIVDMTKKALGTKKVGHLGTLDPLAQGLLVLVIGKATKLTQFLIDHDKIYRFGMVLGAETLTHDEEYPLVKYKGLPKISPKEIENIIVSYIGSYYQKPPIFSAIKIKGTKLCEMARNNEYLKEMDEEKLPPRKVFIYFLDIERLTPPYIQIKSRVSGGTYIRSLSRDIAKDFGCGAFLCFLQRLSVSNFKLNDAFDPYIEKISWDKIISVEDGMKSFLNIKVNSSVEKKIINGSPFSYEEIENFCSYDILTRNNKKPILILSKNSEPLCMAKFEEGKFYILRGLL